MIHEPIELWTARGEVRCVLVPFYLRYQIRLMRGHQTVKTDLYPDEESARFAAREWQRRFQEIEPEVR